MLFSSARPIPPGRLARVRDLTAELAPHRAAYDDLNARFGVHSHAVWVNHPDAEADIWVSVYDIDADGLRAMQARRWEPDHSAYDRWWLAFVREALDVDLLAGPPAASPPELIFDSEAR